MRADFARLGHSLEELLSQVPEVASWISQVIYGLDTLILGLEILLKFFVAVRGELDNIRQSRDFLIEGIPHVRHRA